MPNSFRTAIAKRAYGPVGVVEAGRPKCLSKVFGRIWPTNQSIEFLTLSSGCEPCSMSASVDLHQFCKLLRSRGQVGHLSAFTDDKMRSSCLSLGTLSLHGVPESAAM